MYVLILGGLLYWIRLFQWVFWCSFVFVDSAVDLILTSSCFLFIGGVYLPGTLISRMGKFFGLHLEIGP